MNAKYILSVLLLMAIQVNCGDEAESVKSDYKREMRGVMPMPQEACSESRPNVIHDHSGNITSPDYPSNYPHDSWCEWLFEAPSGWVIEFTVTTFGTENCCVCDYLEIIDGETTEDKQFGHWFSNFRVPPITSTSNHLYVIFKSDYSISDLGFLAEYSMIDVRQE